MPHDTFDEQTAASYDDGSPEMFDPAVLDPTVDFLAALAGDRSALEFGIGTGRVALPLRRRGLPVHGIDISEPMLARLREKPDADSVGLTMGDFATTRVDGRFGLVYLVFNTIMNLTTQDEQVACFANAAAHLEPGGCFVLEVGVPDLRRLPPGETVRAFSFATPTRFGLDEYEDTTTQRMWSHHYRVDGVDARVSSGLFRYVWPSELDLMARLAGLRFRARYADWQGRPFTSESTSHVSIWEKPA